VVATLVARGLARDGRAGSDGRFALPGLFAGGYEVRIEAPGFRMETANLSIVVGETEVLDMRLSLASLTAEVEVVGEAVLVRNAPLVAGAITGEQLDNLPVNGRNWSNLTALAPGAVNTSDGTQASVRVFGRARDDNNWTFDGVDASGVKDPRQEASLRLVMSQEAIAEFQVASASYGAESGTGAGAQVNLVSKTGTNAWQGSLFYFGRRNSLDSRRVLDPLPEEPPFTLNQFGASLGGPLVKDRTFVFVTYEGLRQELGVTSERAVGVPSASLRARALAASPALASVIAAFPVGTPTANPDVDSFVGRKEMRWNEDSFLVRLDHKVSSTTNVFLRYNGVIGDIDSEIRSDYMETRASEVKPSNLTAQLQRVFGLSSVLDIRLGMNRSPLDRTQKGLFAEGVEIVGVTSGSTRATVQNIEQPKSYTFASSFAVARGRHLIKAGAEFRQLHIDVGQDSETTVRFANGAAFVNNTMNRIRVTGDLPLARGRRHYLLGFVQDEIRVNSSFTLQAGLRYEYYSVMTERDGRGRLFDIQNCFPRSSVDFYCPSGTPWYENDPNNLAPRLGFSYSPRGAEGKTVVRGGFGRFYSNGQNDDVMAPVDNIADRLEVTGAGLSYPIAPALSRLSLRAPQPRSLQRDRKDMYADQWSLSVQRDLGSQVLAEVSYIGSRGHNIFNRIYVNTIANGSQPLNTSALRNTNLMDEKGQRGSSRFNGLNVSLTRRARQGLLLQAQYMLAKATDNNAGNGEGSQLMISSCPGCDEGPADFDIRHSFSANAVMQRGGWTLASVVTARTGRPVNVTVNHVGPDGSGDAQRPNLVAGTAAVPSAQTPQRYFDVTAFAVPAAGTSGNVPRNFLRGPGAFQIDAMLSRSVVLAGAKRIELRVEIFNLLNRAQYGNPSANISSPLTFGVLTPLNSGPTGTGTARSIQFASRLRF
jgi:hypothetical protein